MNRDELQARWILSQGWVSAELLKETAAALPRAPGHDLCSLLLMRGLINEAAAAQTRKALESGRNRPDSSRYSDEFKTMAMPSPATNPKGSSRRFARDSRQYSGIQQPAYTSESQRYSRDGFAVSTDIDNMDTIITKEPALKAQPKLQPGQRFQDYEILEEISRGSMGVVYKARNPEGEVLALKIIQAQHENEENTRRFSREAETLIRLEHPNIIKVRDYGSHHGRLFYAMDRVDGRDLLELVQSSIRQSGRPPPWRKSVAYLEGIARALAHCHENHIIHRDVKPQNVMIGRKNLRPILVDFGLMKRVPTLADSASSMGLTKTGETVGTPAFMSPEQYNPGGEHGKPGAPTDVWGFAATLFYALTGLPPFNKPTPVEIYRAITTGEPPRLSAINPRIPPWLDELCAQCLETCPEYRPAMKDVAERLRAGLMDAEDNPAPRSRPALLLPSLVLALALGLAAAALSYALPTPNGRLAELSQLPDQAVTSKDHLEISGHTDPGGILVSIDGETLRSNSDGRFAKTVALAEGHNRFIVGIPSANGLTNRRVAQVIRDTQEPRINFFDPEQKENNPEPSLVIKGQVLDANLQSLTLNGADLDFDDNGRFTRDISNEADLENLRFLATDRAGNSRGINYSFRAAPSRKSPRNDSRSDSKYARLWTPKPGHYDRLERARSRAAELIATAPPPAATPPLPDELRPLSDLALWDKTSPEDQDAAINAVARRIAPRLALDGPREFSCAGSTHRLGVFRHPQSGLEFVLLPGSKRQTTWYFDEAAAQRVAYLRAASQPDIQLGDISWLLSKDHLEDFGEVFHRALPEDARTLDEAPIQSRLSEALLCLRDPQKLARFCAGLAELADLMEAAAARRRTTETIRPFLLARFETPTALISPTLRDAAPSSKPRNRLPPEVIATVLESFGFRLPTPLEWTYACAAGSKELRFWGDPAQIKSFVWHRGNTRGRNIPIDNQDHAQKPNSFGLVDMIGNLAELTAIDHEGWARAWSGVEAVGNKDLAEKAEERRRRILALGSSAQAPAAFQALPELVDRRFPWKYLGSRAALTIPDLDR